MNEKCKSTVIKAILYTLLTALALLCLITFWMMLVNSTRKGNEIMTSFSLLPSTNILENWELVSKNLDIFRGMRNSLFVALCTHILCSYFSALTACGLSRFSFKGNKLLFIIMLVFMMVPAQLGLLGFYYLCNMLNSVYTSSV